MVTKYKILNRDETGYWTEKAAPVEAISAEAAIRKSLDGDAKGGTYVAVPLRSFQPVEVEVETKRSVKIGGQAPIS